MSNPTCIWPGCTPSKSFSRGMCQKHYMRARRLGSFDEPWVDWELSKNPPKSKCRWPGCTSLSKHRGYCARDYTRAYRRNNFDDPWNDWEEPGRPCRWPECDRPVDYRGYCDTHVRRAKRLGNFDNPWVQWAERQQSRKPQTCKWPSCDRVSHARGMCPKHFHRASRIQCFDSPWEVWYQKRQCAVCGSLFRRSRIDAIYCSAKCSDTAFRRNNKESSNKRWSRRRARKFNARYEKFDISDIRSLTGDICYLCGSVIDFDIPNPSPMSPSMDHIVPLSKGGDHTLNNVAMTHLRCNQIKSAKTIDTGPQLVLF